MISPTDISSTGTFTSTGTGTSTSTGTGAGSTDDGSLASRRQDQRNEPFETPSQDEIVAMTGPHVAAMENSTSERTWTLVGMKYVLISAKGRKSGQLRKTPLPYWLDDRGFRIIVASFAGADHHPAWYHNLADRAANPTVTVKERGRIEACEVDVLDGDEHAQIWAAVTADRPFYLDYQAKITRRIPVLRLRVAAAD